MRGLLWPLLLLAGLGPAPAVPPAAVFPPCTPLRRWPPCRNCTAAQRDRVLQRCPMAPIITLEAIPGTASQAVAFHPEWQNGRFGNQLGAFFTARALARLGDFAFDNRTGLVYDDVHLPLQRRPPLFGQQYRSVEELEDFCRRCPLTLVYPTLCPGMWLAGGPRHVLQRALRHHSRSGPPADVAVQFRCSDAHDTPEMGLPPFRYYAAALEGHVNRSSRISVLPDPASTNSSCCMALALTLVAALHRAFGCTVELLQPDRVGSDFAFFMRARIFVAGPSTFGLFAAIATHGAAFLPVSPTLMGNRTPCLDGVRWVAVPAYLEGCSESVLKWFVDPVATPAMHQHLQQLLRGPWFRFSLRHYLHKKAAAVIHSKAVQRVFHG